MAPRNTTPYPQTPYPRPLPPLPQTPTTPTPDPHLSLPLTWPPPTPDHYHPLSPDPHHPLPQPPPGRVLRTFLATIPWAGPLSLIEFHLIDNKIENASVKFELRTYRSPVSHHNHYTNGIQLKLYSAHSANEMNLTQHRKSTNTPWELYFPFSQSLLYFIHFIIFMLRYWHIYCVEIISF